MGKGRGTPSRAKQRLMELLFGWLVNVVSVAFFYYNLFFNQWIGGDRFVKQFAGILMRSY